MYKTIFFKRQSDIINKLFKDKIISKTSNLIIPSYICSEVITSFKSKGINIIFYERDASYIEIINLISNIKKKGKSNPVYFYCYYHFSKFKDISEILYELTKLDINIILDAAHLINFIDQDIIPINLDKLKKIILIGSPRKYLRLTEGGFCKVDNNYLMIRSNNFNFISVFIDNIKNSKTIRILISNIKLRKNKKDFLFNSNYPKINENIQSASIGHQIYFLLKKLFYNYEDKIFYKKYIRLFKSFISPEIKDINFLDNQVYWIIPLNNEKKPIKKLFKYFQYRFDNPLMNWPDYHEYLSSIDKVRFKNNIYFRLDKNTCNNNMYNKISSIIK